MVRTDVYLERKPCKLALELLLVVRSSEATGVEYHATCYYNAFKLALCIQEEEKI